VVVWVEGRREVVAAGARVLHGKPVATEELMSSSYPWCSCSTPPASWCTAPPAKPQRARPVIEDNSLIDRKKKLYTIALQVIMSFNKTWIV
jgi:hypothetical protein